MPDNVQPAAETAKPQALDVNSAADMIRQLSEPEQPQEPEQPEDAPEQDVEAEEDAEQPDPEEPEGDTEQTDEAEEPDEPETPPKKFTVKIDGETHQVTLEEALKGYQRESDYRQKTMALAEQRKAFEQRQKETFDTAQQKLEELAAMGQFLEQQLVGKFQQVNWNELRETDPGEYAALRQEMMEGAQRVQQMKANAARNAQMLQQQQHQAMLEKLPEVLKEQEELLVSKLPDWSENKPERQKALRSYLTENGYRDEEANLITDHRFVVMADKARRYDLMQSAKPQTKRVLKEPSKMLKPGPKQTKSQQQRDKYAAQFNAFRSGGGKVNDAAKLISLLSE